MRQLRLRSLSPAVTLALCLSIAGPYCRAAERSRPDYLRDVRPILSNYCYQCHGPDEAARQADLRLDNRDDAIRELAEGRHAIVPGHPESSEAIARLTTTDADAAMPPASLGRKPTEQEIDTLRRWIEQDAPYALHWAYVAPSRPPLPEVSKPEWGTNPIDRFVLARLDREGISPSGPASRTALLRRAAIDLTGLPASLDEVDQFLADQSPDAFEQAVDRLLKKPAYGERWAAMWLDLARYGDSAGYIHDPLRNNWRWRDWLIQALNDNVPYDRFTRLMLAGDLLPGATTGDVIATGFHRNTTTNTEGGSSAAEYHYASLVDRVNTTMQVWMGTTMACAQCHTHKYDPFTQKDYYQILAIFNSQEDFNSETPAIDVPRVGRDADFASQTAHHVEAKSALDAETARVDTLQAGWEAKVDRATLPKEVAEAIAVETAKRTPQQTDAVRNHHRASHAEWQAADKQVKDFRAALDRIGTTAMVMQEIAPRSTNVFLRGDYRNLGEPVTPGTPASLPAPPEGLKLDRLGLADWIVDPRNPLTARVAVNRLWQELFGVGLVETAEEFGTQGELPSHPELLDWLATEYIRLGWDTKAMLKLIVTSSTYRQSSQGTEALVHSDPYNRLLSRGPRVRLSAEQLRDQALAVSGLLSAKLYGPPVHPYQPANGLAAAFGSSTDWTTSEGEDAHRRALYTLWRRNLPYPSMIAFDVPERSVCSMRRIRTNTPVQALVTLNDPVYVEAAQALARRVLKEGGDNIDSRSAFAIKTVLSRPAEDAEVRRLVNLFDASRTSLAADPARAAALATKPLGPLTEGMDVVDAAAWTVVANVLLNLDETLVKR
jgi:hypothetical protein